MPEAPRRPDMPSDPYRAFNESWVPVSNPYGKSNRKSKPPKRVPSWVWLAVAALVVFLWWLAAR